MNLPRLALLSYLMVFLFFPVFLLGLAATHCSMRPPYDFYAILIWMISTVALLLLGAVYAKKEPDLVRACLRAMGITFLLGFILALSLPAIME